MEAEAASTEVLVKTKMVSPLKARKLNAEEVEVVATRPASEVIAATEVIEVIEAIEVIEVVIAATTEVAATEEAEIVPRRRVRPNQLSNNKTLSELDRAVNSLSSDEMKIPNLEGVH